MNVTRPVVATDTIYVVDASAVLGRCAPTNSPYQLTERAWAPVSCIAAFDLVDDLAGRVSYFHSIGDW